MSPSRSARVRPLLPVAGAVAVVLVALGWWAATASASAAVRAGSSSTARQSAAVRSLTVAGDETGLGYGQAIVLGLVEGVTEFLPISSTGHLTVVERLLRVGVTDEIVDAKRAQDIKEATDAYAVVIQAGAILAVLVLYHRRIASVARGVIGRDDDGRRVGIALVVGFLPAALLAFVFDKKIKEHLFGPWPVVIAWVIGGVVLLALSYGGWFDRRDRAKDLVAITVRDAAIIGAFQCLALWPGTSRSLVTIVGALAIGFTMSAAVEFSFLLGLVTLSAATAYDALKHGKQIVDVFGVATPAVGFVVAFAAGFIAVRWMVSYLQRHSLAIFGWYRLTIAAITVGLILAGTLPT